MKRNCFNVWQRRGPKLVPAPACMLATLTTMLGIPGISTAQKLKLPFTPKSPSQGYKIGTKHYSQHYKCQVCMTTKAMTWACNRLFRAFLQGTYYKLASHLNMATVSDLSRSAMLTPRPVSCSAWYILLAVQELEDVSGLKLTQGEFTFTHKHTQPCPI